MLTLGIETSCDETSVAVVRNDCQILSNIVLGQMIHKDYGGVVPELASREHMKAIILIYNKALNEAGVVFDDIDLIAATSGPGLVGALLVGLNFAKGLAFGRNIRFVAVNHLEGHIAANLLMPQRPPEKHLTLVISGGHTLLLQVDGFGNYRMLGQTKDDAVGEAYDKVAKLLGIGYPGGREIDLLAKKGNPQYFRFPRGMIKDESLDFSYSGLKTAVALHVRSLTETELRKHRADIAASFQEAAVEVLVDKTIRAIEQTGLRDVTLSGGVASNSRLRELMDERIQSIGGHFYYPTPDLCTDNAAMIAAAGYLRLKLSGPSRLDINADPHLRLA
jgi:N6-L-threonylcarbamoyladenine synthase